MKLYTIGFTKKSAEEFFGLLAANGVQKLVDIRLNNKSQLAGFAKGRELDFFSRKMLGIDYEHIVSYAPTKDLLARYRRGSASWEDYEREFMDILKERKILEDLDIHTLKDACLLCSEEKPDQCHRRLLAEYIHQTYPEVEIVHLK